MDNKLAVQLYTLREEVKQGIRPLFKTLKEMGWSGVQISALPKDYDKHEVALALKENNLHAAGMHISYARLTNDLTGVLTEAQLYGTKDIILPSVPQDMRSVEGIKEIKKGLNRIAKEAPDYRFSYHNHAFEFDINIEGQEGLRYLLDPSNENAILAEIDVYWLKKAGIDPLEYITPYSNRMPIIHLKDMTHDQPQTFAEVGTGVIDFIPILQWGEANAIEWYAVEQDVCERPPLESLEISLQNLQEYAKTIKVIGSEV
jgi:sugar phosphate isomerase/epimerase